MANRASSLVRVSCLALCAALLAACSAPSRTADRPMSKTDYRNAIAAFSNPGADEGSLDPIAAAAYWGALYEREPSAQAGVQYSRALRKIGSTSEAVGVMARLAARHGDDPDVSLEYGKALIEDGRAFEAVRHLENAIHARRGDWRALSAYGVSLDHIGEHARAREIYNEALALAPDAVSVLSNKALSYALSGDVARAVQILRHATANRRGDARIRQNLALVLALNGELAEAERLARSDLPPQIADQNIGFYQALVAPSGYWGDFAATGAETPNFDAPRFETPSPLTQDAPKKPEKRAQEQSDEGAPLTLSVPAPATPASHSRPDGE